MENKLNLVLGYKNSSIFVVDYIDDTNNYQNNKGYIDRKTENIYIFSEDGTSKHVDIPIIYFDSSGKLCKKALSDITLDLFHVKNTYKLDLDHIINSTSGTEVLYNEEALNNINAVMSTFIPVVNADDDPLKKMVKLIIIQKGININTLRHKIGTPYQLTNMRQALCGKTKMSITNFLLWSELLDFDFDFVVYDRQSNDTVEYPMKAYISFSSNKSEIAICEDHNIKKLERTN